MASLKLPAWYARAACLEANTEIFFAFGSDGVGRTAEACETTKAAKAVCEGCPVKSDCLEWALSNESSGVWGGTTAYERRRIREKRAEQAALERSGANGPQDRLLAEQFGPINELVRELPGIVPGRVHPRGRPRRPRPRAGVS